MGQEFCTRPCELHIQRIGIGVLQMFPHYEEWWGGLHATSNYSTIT